MDGTNLRTLSVSFLPPSTQNFGLTAPQKLAGTDTLHVALCISFHVKTTCRIHIISGHMSMFTYDKNLQDEHRCRLMAVLY